MPQIFFLPLFVMLGLKFLKLSQFLQGQILSLFVTQYDQGQSH